jgi:hypothetical protein
VKAALTSLPCVEPNSIRTDIKTKQARFQVKKDATCDLEEVKKAVANAGKFTVTDVKVPTRK